MGLFDRIKKVAEEVTEQATEVLPEFDPTSPSATYGQVTQAAGEAVVTVATDGAGSGLFSTVTNGIGDLNQATDNAFTVNNIGETANTFVSQAPGIFNNVVSDPDVFINEVIPEFDPTAPNSSFGDNTQTVGETVVTTIFGDSASGLFTTVTDGIGDLNQATDNAFTVNNIGETADTFINSVSLVEEPSFYPEDVTNCWDVPVSPIGQPDLITEVASAPVGSIEDLHSEISDIVDFGF